MFPPSLSSTVTLAVSYLCLRFDSLHSPDLTKWNRFQSLWQNNWPDLEKNIFLTFHNFFLYKSKRMFVWLSLCVMQPLTTKPISFSFSGTLIIVPGKVYNYFLGSTLQKNRPQQKIICPPNKHFFQLFLLKSKNESMDPSSFFKYH